MQALSAALEEFPTLNSSLNSKADALLQHTPHNIGVAMATPAGLVVPNIKDVQKRNVAGIAAELTRLQRDATLGRVNQFDVTGGTISMSNIGEDTVFARFYRQQCCVKTALQFMTWDSQAYWKPYLHAQVHTDMVVNVLHGSVQHGLSKVKRLHHCIA